MRVRRGILKAGIGGMAVVAGAASVAWGCASVTSPYLNALEPNRGAVPASVVVSGGNWAKNTPVNLVWAPTGQPIGSATTSGNGDFSARVTIPQEAEIGKDYVNYVRATQGTTTGNTPFGVDSPAEDKAFEVPAPAPVTYASTSGADPNRQPVAQPVEETQAAPAPTGGSGGIPSRPAETGGTTAGETAAAPATVTNASGSATPAPVRTAAPSREQSTSPAAARAAALASPLAPTGPSTATAAPVTEEEAATAAARSASGDLWSGFAQGPSTVGSPSLTTLPTTTSGTSPLAIGMGVLSAGLVALFAGFGVADLRRRKVLVTSDNG